MQANPILSKNVISLMKSNFAVSSISFILDIVIWYLVLSFGELELIISALAIHLLRFIFLFPVYFYLKKIFLRPFKFKFLCNIYFLSAYLSLLFSFFQYIVIFLKVKEIKTNTKTIVSYFLMGVSVILHIGCFVLFNMENNKNQLILKELLEEEIRREIMFNQMISTGNRDLSKNDTVGSENEENNKEDPNFKKEDTFIIVQIGKEKNNPSENQNIIKIRTNKKYNNDPQSIRDNNNDNKGNKAKSEKNQSQSPIVIMVNKKTNQDRGNLENNGTNITKENDNILFFSTNRELKDEKEKQIIEDKKNEEDVKIVSIGKKDEIIIKNQKKNMSKKVAVQKNSESLKSKLNCSEDIAAAMSSNRKHLKSTNNTEEDENCQEDN